MRAGWSQVRADLGSARRVELVRPLLPAPRATLEDWMLRTLPSPRDVDTVVAFRPPPSRPAPAPLADKTLVEAASGARPARCTPFSETLVSGSMPEQKAPAMAPEAPVETTSPYQTGTIIAERYRLLRQLGRGGMGEVWSAHHLALNTEVAVKFLSTGAGGSAARLALERFRFEAQVSAHLGLKTSHVVAVHDAGSDAIGPYLVMEHVRGRTLRADLNRAGPLSLENVVRLLDQVTEALAVAHAFGIVHRDLKPSNLLLVDQPDGALYV